jgi:large subunit ribosomal protein L22
MAAATSTTTEGVREVRAVAKWLRITPRKARLTVDHIRGRTVPEARTVLAFTERAAAREVEKVLRSAVANAEANHDLIGDDLVITKVVVDEGPTIKRWRARARGRAARIGKRTCHITLTLAPADGAEAPRQRPPRSVPAQSAETGADAPGASKEKAASRREARAEAAQSDEVSPAEEAEGAASEEKPKRSRRKPKEGSQD